MTSITIRRVPDATKEKLRHDAVRSGLSLEAYLRQVLQTTSESGLPQTENLADLACKCFGSDNGVSLELPPRGNERPPPAFD